MTTQFAISTRKFLIFYWKSDNPLVPPLNISTTDTPIARPFIISPLNELSECYIIARRPTHLLRKKNQIFQISDSTGRQQKWEQHGLGNSDYQEPELKSWIRLFATIEKHLEIKYGQLSAVDWNELATLLSSFIPAEYFALPDGRHYWRIRISTTGSAVDIRNCQIHIPGQIDKATHSVFMLESGWLHFTTPRPESKSASTNTWIIRTDPNTPIPFSVLHATPLTVEEDIFESILKEYPGDREFLTQFLDTALRIKQPLDQVTKDTIANLTCNFSELQNGQLKGVLFDKRHPDRQVEVGISLDGKPYTKTIADLPHPKGGMGNHGFSISINPELLDGKHHQFQLSLPINPTVKFGPVFSIGENNFDGSFELIGGKNITGWIRQRCVPQRTLNLALFIDGSHVSSITVLPDPNTDKARFNLELPESIQNGLLHELELRILKADGDTIPFKEPLAYQAAYKGAIIKCDTNSVSGWILNEKAPDTLVSLDLYINGIKDFTTETKPFKDSSGRTLYGFSVFFEKPTTFEPVRTISFCIAGTTHEVLGPRRLITAPATIIQNLNDSSAFLLARKNSLLESEWIRRQVFSPLIKTFRKSPNIPHSVTLELSPVIQSLEYRSPALIIDVIVPVYNGLPETLACIDSLLGSTGHRSYEIVVINDHSPEQSLTENLRSLASNGKITLLENPKNLGFVASANRGLKLHTDRDAVLLNSDTVMPAGVIDRMRRVAYSNQAIGTVTPFSNNATICSFPQFNADNVIPRGWDLNALDAELAQIHGDDYVDIPTAVGFCMYIKRQVIDEIGLLDEQQWGKGYGEENDFCLRASTLGWRHVLAAGIFVQHHGSVSFGTDKSGLLAANLSKLNRLYPDYPATIQQFLQNDPIAPYRNPVIVKLMREVSDRFMLYVSHALGGGTQVAIEDMIERLENEGVRVLELRSCIGDNWELKLHGTPYVLVYRANQWDKLLDDLRLLNVWHVHFHQIPFFGKSITELGNRLGVPYDVTIHDYLPICPRINMLDETGWYCGDSQFDASTCNRCVKALGTDEGVEPLYAEHGNDVATWRARFADFLKGARKVFTPSMATLAILNRHFNLGHAVALPHQEAPFQIPPIPSKSDLTVNVAVIGAIGRHKGFDILLACARSALKDGLPLRFIVIGFTHDDAPLQSLDNVVITGRYQRNDLPTLLTKYGCRIAAFLSPWPETYCYALTEAWRSGVYPVAFDLGAQAERIRAAGWGEVLPAYSSHPKQINQALLNAAKRAETAGPPESAIGSEYESVLENYYALAGQKPRKASRKKRH